MPIQTDLTVSDLLKGDLKLASPFNLYFELNKFIESQTRSMSDAGLIIENDPGLSARLLKIVNSAFFGFSYKISTITRAITMIGISDLQNLVLTTLVINKFSSLPGGLMSMKEFWSTSLRCALIARELSNRFFDHELSESIFIGGLLHEIGLLVFYLKIPELTREVELMIESTGTDEIQAERQMLGFDHYHIGAELTHLWKLPEIVTTTIRHHQDPSLAKNYHHQTAIIKLASQIAKKEILGVHCLQEPQWNLVKLSPQEFDSVIALTKKLYDETFQTFFPMLPAKGSANLRR